MKIIRLQSPEVDHIIQPTIKKLLEAADAVIVSPAMGVSQYEPFGERAIVDCINYLGSRRADGVPDTVFVQELATKYGLSIMVHPLTCPGCYPDAYKEARP